MRRFANEGAAGWTIAANFVNIDCACANDFNFWRGKLIAKSFAKMKLPG